MRALVASIIVLQLVFPTAVRADATEAAAQVHLDRGIAAFRAADFALARKELLAASELAPNKPNPYRWLALAEVQLGDCEHALVDIESFLSRVPPEDARVPELVRLRDLCQHPALPGVSGEPTPSVVEKPAPPPPAHDTPVTHRWWFWTAIGAVALTSVGLVLYATRDSETTVLPPVTCGAAGCTP